MNIDAVIQGARTHALVKNTLVRAALSAFKEQLHHSSTHDVKELMLELIRSHRKVVHALPHEPALHNALRFVFYDPSTTSVVHLTKDMCERIDSLISYYTIVDKKIAQQSQSIIPKGATVFTHGYSESVLRILEKAHLDGKNIEVHVSETRPQLAGRKMARALHALGISTHVCVDGAASTALKKSDVCLLGCSAITPHGYQSTIGTDAMSVLANHHHVPVYMCTHAWKFQRKKHEPSAAAALLSHPVWKDAPRGVGVANHLTTHVEEHTVHAIISEFGVQHHRSFVKEIKKRYPWLAQ